MLESYNIIESKTEGRDSAKATKVWQNTGKIVILICAVTVVESLYSLHIEFCCSSFMTQRGLLIRSISVHAFQTPNKCFHSPDQSHSLDRIGMFS